MSILYSSKPEPWCVDLHWNPGANRPRFVGNTQQPPGVDLLEVFVADKNAVSGDKNTSLNLTCFLTQYGIPCHWLSEESEVKLMQDNLNVSKFAIPMNGLPRKRLLLP